MAEPIEHEPWIGAVNETDLALKRYDLILRYLAVDTQVFWTRSQLFLVANAAFAGFALKEIPVAPASRLSQIITLLIGAVVGILLCCLWIRGITVGNAWMDHWRVTLKTWEEQAFGDVNIFRQRPVSIPTPSSVAKKAAYVFISIWFLTAAYLLVCVVLKLCGGQLP